MTDVNDEPVLSISTIAPDRPKVRVVTDKKQPDGRFYGLRVRSEFGAREWFALQRDLAEHDRLAQSETELDEAQVDRVEDLASQMAARVLTAPQTVLGALTYRQRMDVVLTFQLLQFQEPTTEKTEQTGLETDSREPSMTTVS